MHKTNIPHIRLISRFFPKIDPEIGFSKMWPILCHPVCKMLRISPRSFLAWFWSLILLTIFSTLDFPGMFSPKRGTWQGWRRRRGRRRPPVGGPRPQKITKIGVWGFGGVGGGLPPWALLACLGLIGPRCCIQYKGPDPQ